MTGCDAGLGHFRRTDGANPTNYEEWWRAGHNHRYAINASKLGSRSHVDFRDGIGRTVHRYLDHKARWRDITSGA